MSSSKVNGPKKWKRKFPGNVQLKRKCLLTVIIFFREKKKTRKILYESHQNVPKQRTPQCILHTPMDSCFWVYWNTGAFLYCTWRCEEAVRRQENTYNRMMRWIMNWSLFPFEARTSLAHPAVTRVLLASSAVPNTCILYGFLKGFCQFLVCNLLWPYFISPGPICQSGTLW